MTERNCDLPDIAAEVEAMKEDAAFNEMNDEPLDMKIFHYNQNVISMILTDMLERGRG